MGSGHLPETSKPHPDLSTSALELEHFGFRNLGPLTMKRMPLGVLLRHCYQGFGSWCFYFAKGVTRHAPADSWDEARHRRPIQCDQSNEHCIKKSLFAGHRYDRSTRPVLADLTTTKLYVGVSLYHILDSVRSSLAVPYASCTNTSP